MGNDGGSIPTRRELVKSAARGPTASELKATALESLGHAWTHCAISSEPLDTDNAVSDWRGALYNYESVIKSLIPGDDGAAPTAEDEAFTASGIKSLRDVVRLQLTHREADEAPAPRGRNGLNGQGEPVRKKRRMVVCPLSMKELGPAVKAAYIVPCGHTFAQAAIYEVSDGVCPVCSEPFTEGNIVTVLPTEEAEVRRLFDRFERLRNERLSHCLMKYKKGDKKKNKKRKGEDANSEGTSGERANGEANPSKDVRNKKGDSAAGGLSGINNSLAASVAAKVLAEQEDRKKRRKIGAP